MATNKLPNVVANVTASNEDLWSRFIETARSLGLSRTSALTQAASLWLRANTAPDGSPRLHNPFSAGPAATSNSFEGVATPSDPFEGVATFPAPSLEEVAIPSKEPDGDSSVSAPVNPFAGNV